MKDVHRAALNGEQNLIHVEFAAVEELPHFKRKTYAFGSNRATLRKRSKRRDSIIQRMPVPRVVR
jgi:hypothetical protein